MKRNEMNNTNNNSNKFIIMHHLFGGINFHLFVAHGDTGISEYGCCRNLTTIFRLILMLNFVGHVGSILLPFGISALSPKWPIIDNSLRIILFFFYRLWLSNLACHQITAESLAQIFYVNR